MRHMKERAPTAANGRGARNSGQRFHVHSATAAPLLQRLDGVQKSGNGWRAKCPACGGTSRKVSVTETGERVLVHCFGGCRAEDVVGAVGLTWADLFPPRQWPESPEERRQARRAIREAGWAAALDVLALEAQIVNVAAYEIHCLGGLQSSTDLARLQLACERIGDAANVLTEARR